MYVINLLLSSEKSFHMGGGALKCPNVCAVEIDRWVEGWIDLILVLEFKYDIGD